MILSAQTAASGKPAQLEGARINDPGTMLLENGVDIGFWPALSSDRHLARLAGTIKRTFFAVFNEFRRVADHD